MHLLQILSISILIIIGQNAVQIESIPDNNYSCRVTDWSISVDSCQRIDKDWPIEIYREEVGLYIRRMCCRFPDRNIEQTRRLEDLKASARGCQITRCTLLSNNSINYDICAAQLPLRILPHVKYFEWSELINNDRNRRNRPNYVLQYREEIREECPAPTGQVGYAAVCCTTRSDSALLGMFAAELHEFPYIAHLHYEDRTGNCGGAIYNDRHVITAAHCVVGSDKNPFPEPKLRITVGTNIDRLANPSDDRVFHVEKIFHPEYKSTSCKLNDIAVIRVNRTIPFNHNVRPIKIAPEGFDPLLYGSHAIVAGWGEAVTLRPIPFLRKTNLRIRDDRSCFRNEQLHQSHLWGDSCNGVNRTEQFMCMGGLADQDEQNENSSPFVLGKGDSGSPVVCKDADGSAVVCGVASFGGDLKKCVNRRDSRSCSFNAAAELQYFNRFIQETAGAQNLKDLYDYKPFGEPAGSKEFSHQVRIVSDSNITGPCGGTLIWKNLVLTAAHCVQWTDNYFVQVGVRDLNDNSQVQKIKVKVVQTLPGFGSENVRLRTVKGVWSMFYKYRYNLPTDAVPFNKDLALLVLETSAAISEDKLPKLRSVEFVLNWPPHGQATEVAFQKSSIGSSSNVLRKRKFTLLNRAECIERMKRSHYEFFRDDWLCGVERGSGGSLCDRELGGGLFCGPKGGILCGIQILRSCQTNTPGLFLNVGIYREWIVSVDKEYNGGAWLKWMNEEFRKKGGVSYFR